MTNTQQTQLEASNKFNHRGIRRHNRPRYEYRNRGGHAIVPAKPQKILGVRFIAATTKKDKNLRPLIKFVKTRDWESIKTLHGQYTGSHSIVQMSQSCQYSTERGKNLKPIIDFKNFSLQMEPVVEPNEKKNSYIPDEPNNDAYILVATTMHTYIAINFIFRYISNNGSLQRVSCDQAQTFRAK